MDRRFFWAAGMAVGALAVVGFLYLVRSVVLPLFLALVLAYFLDPAVDALERRHLGRSAAVTLVFAGFFLVAGSLVAFLAPAIQNEFAVMQDAFPRYASNLYNWIPAPVLDRLGISGGTELQFWLDRLVAGARQLSLDALNQVVVVLSRAFSSTLSFILALLGYLVIPLYLFYLLRDFDRLKAQGVAALPVRYRQEILAFGHDIDGVLSGFIRGQLTVCLILGVCYSVGLAVIGVDMALVIGLFSGLAFLIPYLGTLLGIVWAGFMAAAKFHDLLHPLLVVAWFVLLQLLEGLVITPRLVGDRVGLHPLATILALLVGGELFGFLGLLFAVPVAASVKVLARHLHRHHRGVLLLQEPFGGGE